MRLYDIAANRAQDLAARLRNAGYTALAASHPDPAGADLVVNASPLGMQDDDPLPLDPATLAPSMLVADVVIKSPLTRFLAEAQRAGCRIQLGEAVMLNQVDVMVDFFLRRQDAAG